MTREGARSLKISKGMQMYSAVLTGGRTTRRKKAMNVLPKTKAFPFSSAYWPRAAKKQEQSTNSGCCSVSRNVCIGTRR